MLGNPKAGIETTELSVTHLLANPWDLLLPMTVGGLISFGVVWTAFFFPLRRAIAAYQSRREARRRRRFAEDEGPLVPQHGHFESVRPSGGRVGPLRREGETE